MLLGPAGRWVLCDFGSASARQGVLETAGEIALEEEVVRRYTTPAYRAPEVRTPLAVHMLPLSIASSVLQSANVSERQSRSMLSPACAATNLPPPPRPAPPAPPRPRLQLYDLYAREYVGPAVDIWALGVLTYLLAFGRLPFEGEAKLQVLNGRYAMPPPPTEGAAAPAPRPPGLLALIRDMLAVSPAARPDIHQVCCCCTRSTSRPLLGASLPCLRSSCSLPFCPADRLLLLGVVQVVARLESLLGPEEDGGGAADVEDVEERGLGRALPAATTALAEGQLLAGSGSGASGRLLSSTLSGSTPSTSSFAGALPPSMHERALSGGWADFGSGPPSPAQAAAAAAAGRSRPGSGELGMWATFSPKSRSGSGGRGFTWSSFGEAAPAEDDEVSEAEAETEAAAEAAVQAAAQAAAQASLTLARQQQQLQASAQCLAPSRSSPLDPTPLPAAASASAHHGAEETSPLSAGLTRIGQQQQQAMLAGEAEELRQHCGVLEELLDVSGAVGR